MSPARRFSDRQRWTVFALLLVGAFLPPLNFAIIIVAMPAMVAELHADAAAVQFAISGYVGIYAASLIAGGRLGDVFGHVRMYVVGMIGFALACTLCGLAWSPSALVAGRICQGLAAAVIAPQALALVHVLFPEHLKPRALGLYAATFGLATLLGQVLGGALTALDLFGLGWRLIFLIDLPLIAGALLCGLVWLREIQPRCPARRIDLAGAGLCILTFACVLVPLIEGRSRGWPWWAFALLASAPLMGLLFWRHEARVCRLGGEPLIPASALRVPGLRIGLAAALMFYSIAAFFLLLSIYLQSALGETALRAGLLFLPFGLGFVMGPLATPWALKLAGRRLVGLGMGVEVVGFLTLSWMVATASTSARPASFPFAATLFVIGVGQGLALPPLVRSITSRAAPRHAGLIAGLLNATLQLSAALSVAVIGGIFYAVLDGRSDAAAISNAFVVAMLCIAGGITLAAILAHGLASADALRETSARRPPSSSVQ
ncbi:MFS transporter [Variovorax sp. J22R133]|nr:MFS transporter [Variovorax sp. J22R133]MDM0117827.1 MFS transporter [Variovorax sp. J22R133]